MSMVCYTWWSKQKNFYWGYQLVWSYQSLYFVTSLLDNASKYPVGCVIQKRYYKINFPNGQFSNPISIFFLNEYYYLADDRIESPNSKTLKMEVGKYYSVEPRRA